MGRRRLEGQANEPGDDFPQESPARLPGTEPPNCPHLERSTCVKRSQPGPGVTPASLGRHRAACLPSGADSKPPLTERWAWPIPSHQTPRSRSQPISAAARARAALPSRDGTRAGSWAWGARRLAWGVCSCGLRVACGLLVVVPQGRTTITLTYQHTYFLLCLFSFASLFCQSLPGERKP
jgi:hypothetical protein